MQNYPKIKMTLKAISPEELKIWLDYSAGLFSIGHINDEEYRLLLHAQMPVDSIGNLWTIGTESGRWYRLEDGEWEEDIPPMTLYMMVPEETLRQLEREDERKFNEALARHRAGQPPSSPIPAPVPEPSKAAEATPSAESVICSRCGTENPGNSKFCIKCGSAMQSQKVRKRFCTKCGVENPVDAVFCKDCGNKPTT